MKRGICVLGSTGSIGQNTLNVIAQHPDKFEVIALSAATSVDILFEQCCIFKPKFALMVDQDSAQLLAQKVTSQGLKTHVLSGKEDLVTLVQLPEVDKVVAAIVGAAGLISTWKAVEAGKQILLANKEALVMGGERMMALAQHSGAILLPVDSEHNALFQCMPAYYKTGTRPANVEKIILTASGGPFLNRDPHTFSDITPEMACKHPNWNMGKKITVDCSTLMNKGLEVIEACHLFQLNPQEVEVLIHPQSVIHSMVEYKDGSVLAQLGVPDMRVPISYCLGWPERIESHTPRLDLAQIAQLNFSKPNFSIFKCLALAYEALKLGGAASTVLNASNEMAVQAFLNNQMSFSQIPIAIEKALSKYYDLSDNSLDCIVEADRLTREYTQHLIQQQAL